MTGPSTGDLVAESGSRDVTRGPVVVGGPDREHLVAMLAGDRGHRLRLANQVPANLRLRGCELVTAAVEDGDLGIPVRDLAPGGSGGGADDEEAARSDGHVQGVFVRCGEAEGGGFGFACATVND